MELRVKIVAGASRSKIVGVLGDRLKVRIAAPPENGKANQALILLLSQWLETKDVTLVAGHSSAEKTVFIAGINELRDVRLSFIKS